MTATDMPLPRRSVLTGGALAVSGGALLAGCGGSSPSTGAATSASAPVSTSSGGGGAALAQLSAIPVGGAVSATLDGKPALVAQPTKGTAVAFSAICTYKSCTVAPAGKILACPCHGSTYDAATGKVLGGPAPRALAPVLVQVKDGAVVAGSA